MKRIVWTIINIFCIYFAINLSLMFWDVANRTMTATELNKQFPQSLLVWIMSDMVDNIKFSNTKWYLIGTIPFGIYNTYGVFKHMFKGD